MNNNWKAQLQAVLDAGQTPSYDLIEMALHGALRERNALEDTVRDMGEWLGRLTAAYLHQAGGTLPDVMREFVTAKVKIQVTDEDGSKSSAAPATPTTH